MIVADKATPAAVTVAGVRAMPRLLLLLRDLFTRYEGSKTSAWREIGARR